MKSEVLRSVRILRQKSKFILVILDAIIFFLALTHNFEIPLLIECRHSSNKYIKEDIIEGHLVAENGRSVKYSHGELRTTRHDPSIFSLENRDALFYQKGQHRIYIKMNGDQINLGEHRKHGKLIVDKVSKHKDAEFSGHKVSKNAKADFSIENSQGDPAMIGEDVVFFRASEKKIPGKHVSDPNHSGSHENSGSYEYDSEEDPKFGTYVKKKHHNKKNHSKKHNKEHNKEHDKEHSTKNEHRKNKNHHKKKKKHKKHHKKEKEEASSYHYETSRY